jgi:hypothetical protein
MFHDSSINGADDLPDPFPAMPHASTSRGRR